MSRLSFENNVEIGVYCKLANNYCLIPDNCGAGFAKGVNMGINGRAPIIKCSIGGSLIVGSLCVGNKHGLVVPSMTSDQELQYLKDSLPDGLVVRRVDERLSALGNIVCCNDYVGLIHPDVDQETEELIKDALKIELFRETVAKNKLVGSYALMNNSACVVHPRTPKDEQEQLANLLGLPVASSSINAGSDMIGVGAIVNDWTLFYGSTTTTTEAYLLQTMFKINPSVYGEEEIIGGDGDDDAYEKLKKPIIDSLT